MASNISHICRCASDNLSSPPACSTISALAFFCFAHHFRHASQLVEEVTKLVLWNAWCFPNSCLHGPIGGCLTTLFLASGEAVFQFHNLKAGAGADRSSHSRQNSAMATAQISSMWRSRSGPIRDQRGSWQLPLRRSRDRPSHKPPAPPAQARGGSQKSALRPEYRGRAAFPPASVVRGSRQ